MIAKLIYSVYFYIYSGYNVPISFISQVYDIGFRTCLSFGRYYFRTFDGREYNYAGQCKFILAQDYTAQWQVYMTPINCEAPETCRKV